MKKFTSIMLFFLMLAVAMGATIDRHFCGGAVVDVRLAVNDKHATCGMEQDGITCTHTPAFKNNCCHNVLSKFSVSDYSISSILTIDKPHDSVSHILFQVPEVNLFNSSRNLLTVNDAGPPGFDLFLPDQQSILCIFRI